MRLFHTFDDQKDAIHFSTFLSKEGIDNQCEITANTDWGSSDYGTVKSVVWIIDEDEVATAQKWLDEFLKNPNNPVFNEQEKWKAPLVDSLQTLKEVPQKISQASREALPLEKRGLGFVTLYLFIFCIVLFIYAQFSSPQVQGFYPTLPAIPIEFPPIYKALLYDYPLDYEIIDRLIKAYGVEKLQNLAELPIEGRLLLEKYYQTPHWEGIYNYVVAYLKNPAKPLSFDAPLFEKIQEGEYWRVFTPILLHANVLHLFFNVIWLVVLGKLIEDKIGSVSFLTFVLITAAISNTAQYLMSGPEFLGISGVICAMLGFIWARQHSAAWEGYNLMPGVISFMFIFIGVIAAIQLVAFFLQVYQNINIMPGIANTAHISGAISGYIIGRLNLFPMKVSS